MTRRRTTVCAANHPSPRLPKALGSKSSSNNSRADSGVTRERSPLFRSLFVPVPLTWSRSASALNFWHRSRDRLGWLERDLQCAGWWDLREFAHSPRETAPALSTRGRAVTMRTATRVIQH